MASKAWASTLLRALCLSDSFLKTQYPIPAAAPRQFQTFTPGAFFPSGVTTRSMNSKLP